MRRLIPGPYTFLLPATKLVPKLVMNPKRKATGIRVPDYPFCLAVLQALENPVISTSAHMLENNDSINDNRALDHTEVSRFELFDCLENLVDVIVDTGVDPGFQVSTILDMTEQEPIIVRKGLGWEEAATWVVEAS
jgi:tRNA threonylcarbamoyl adenosine modification protein (Sua5/YciO/YrdC/YwlC family)